MVVVLLHLQVHKGGIFAYIIFLQYESFFFLRLGVPQIIMYFNFYCLSEIKIRKVQKLSALAIYVHQGMMVCSVFHTLGGLT